ncbi:MAG TPA: translation elongation factor Ts [Bacteroidales bacterium]|nr:translation elongation factor Ts [Bacteroidales bacterium]
MATISAADVAKLRKSTGAGMMNCKKALQEADGDFEKAVGIIRKKGQAVASKRADRDAGEGVVLAKTTEDGKYGAMIVLNCETDFVAKNDDFVKFAFNILDKALETKPDSLDSLKDTPIDGVSIGEMVVEQIGIIGEKIDLSFFDSLATDFVQPYIHPGNKLATLVGFNKAGLDARFYKDVAMQVAAMNPLAVDKEDVSEKVIQQELEIGMEQARREGKPEELLERIAQGKLGKFFKENTLMNQDFVKDNKMTIRQYLQSADKDLKIIGFKRVNLNN